MRKTSLYRQPLGNPIPIAELITPNQARLLPQSTLHGGYYVIIANMSGEITYWQDPSDGKWLGYWNDYPDYMTMTEGYSFDNPCEAPRIVIRNS